MSTGDGRKVSLQDIQLVQNLIERCLQLYMTKREVVNTLYHQAKIEPDFTELVWQKLEAENQEFFRAYYAKLTVKDQILRFNQLLERQVELMHQMSQNRASLAPLSNGSQTHHSIHRNTAYRDPQPHIPSLKSKNMHPVVSVVPNGYTNGTYSLQQHMQVAANFPGHAGRMDFHPHMPRVQNSNAGIMQGFNERTIKTEGVYAGNSPVMFVPDNNYAESHNVIRETSISPFNGGESCSQSFNESMLETEMNSFGVEQMTQNHTLSDLTADYSNSTDILESYSRSPYLGTNTNLLNPNIRPVDQDYRRLETLSGGFTYEGFGTN
ncbi:uncharacterized protein LOC131002567 [Salvia miltiorrhiza]|uniref:uncharacterized protein LOC131002567 n=1 Tax=Salvia miltiorrhiza TaxID=226208 RepID=UPI0025ACD7FA|nr:uncharacterized protein LOC131002567 [Salvia miltiorrhiza]XP_057785025.1 uncharacterized protein LOC131002567 [Salvia miltiorrhiza]XP_057785029.1 uncharacterized protein LOC131002567 [Salvia miltiorrhiza]XP_057785037.1 uncharacterized protein LOC131002567 [Salvia miltiorrhiza]XP_057785044.1 uncharacterized protein LOC131002567 [Salvia miltiorrhiza]XP_057785051.1 uncharacterized protein LOC131002567 [Salvia miltiorrhiza]